jgi:hypothetical protein
MERRPRRDRATTNKGRGKSWGYGKLLKGWRVHVQWANGYWYTGKVIGTFLPAAIQRQVTCARVRARAHSLLPPPCRAPHGSTGRAAHGPPPLLGHCPLSSRIVRFEGNLQCWCPVTGTLTRTWSLAILDAKSLT